MLKLYLYRDSSLIAVLTTSKKTGLGMFLQQHENKQTNHSPMYVSNCSVPSRISIRSKHHDQTSPLDLVWLTSGCGKLSIWPWYHGILAWLMLVGFFYFRLICWGDKYSNMDTLDIRRSPKMNYGFKNVLNVLPPSTNGKLVVWGPVVWDSTVETPK